MKKVDKEGSTQIYTTVINKPTQPVRAYVCIYSIKVNDDGNIFADDYVSRTTL